MSASFNKVQELLGWTDLEIATFLDYCQKAGFFDPDYIQGVLRDHFRLNFIDSSRAAEMASRYLHHHLHEELLERTQWLKQHFLPDEKYAPLLLGLFEFFGQDFFRGADEKEQFKTQHSEFTGALDSEALEMGRVFRLNEPRALTKPADVMLVMGATSKMIWSYLNHLKACGQSFSTIAILLGGRKLNRSIAQGAEPKITSDDPLSPSEDFPYPDGGGLSYMEYLSKLFHIDIEQLTEGHAMLDQLNRQYPGEFDSMMADASARIISGESSHIHIKQFVFIIGTKNSWDFYHQAIAKCRIVDEAEVEASATGADDVDTQPLSIAFISVGPHFRVYDANVRNQCALLGIDKSTIEGVGPAGVVSATRIARAIGSEVDTKYDSAAMKLVQTTGVECLSKSQLRISGRVGERAYPETYELVFATSETPAGLWQPRGSKTPDPVRPQFDNDGPPRSDSARI